MAALITLSHLRLKTGHVGSDHQEARAPEVQSVHSSETARLKARRKVISSRGHPVRQKTANSGFPKTATRQAKARQEKKVGLLVPVTTKGSCSTKTMGATTGIRPFFVLHKKKAKQVRYALSLRPPQHG